MNKCTGIEGAGSIACPVDLVALSNSLSELKKAPCYEFKDALAALSSEVVELQKASSESDIKDELGDVIYCAIHAAQLKGLDVNECLKNTIMKVQKRVGLLKHATEDGGKDRSRDELEALYQEVKNRGAL